MSFLLPSSPVLSHFLCVSHGWLHRRCRMTVESGCMCACHMLNIISHHNDCLCFILVAILLHNQHVTHDAVLTYTQRNHATDLEPCTSHTTLIPTWLATLDMMAKGSHVGPEITDGAGTKMEFLLNVFPIYVWFYKWLFHRPTGAKWPPWCVMVIGCGIKRKKETIANWLFQMVLRHIWNCGPKRSCKGRALFHCWSGHGTYLENEMGNGRHVYLALLVTKVTLCNPKKPVPTSCRICVVSMVLPKTFTIPTIPCMYFYSCLQVGLKSLYSMSYDIPIAALFQQTP